MIRMRGLRWRVANDAEWEALLSRVGRCGGGVRLAVFDVALRRWKHRAALDAALGAWTVGWDAIELAERLQGAGVPASAVMGARTLLRDAQIVARQAVGALEHPQVGASPAPQAAYRLSETPAPPKSAAPLFAADTRSVLREMLGYSGARIAELLEAGVVAETLV